jgi:hypothetical protein
VPLTIFFWPLLVSVMLFVAGKQTVGRVQNELLQRTIVIVLASVALGAVGLGWLLIEAAPTRLAGGDTCPIGHLADTGGFTSAVAAALVAIATGALVSLLARHRLFLLAGMSVVVSLAVVALGSVLPMVFLSACGS